MATTPNLNSYAGRTLTGADWGALGQQGIKSNMIGKTVNGYQVYSAGQGDIRLRAVPGAPAAPAPVPAAAPAGVPKPAVAAAPAAPKPVVPAVPAAPAPKAPTTLAGANAAAQTYSATPGATPANYSTNQGTQDYLRNQALATAQKGTDIDPNDPVMRQQTDAYDAASERARRNELEDNAEAFNAKGMGGSGAQDVAMRAANESSRQGQAGFAADLASRELQNRRSEIQNSLQSLQGMLTQDEQQKMQRDLAALNAQIQQSQITQTGQLGNKELDQKMALGTGDLNNNMMGMLLQNGQAGRNLGFNYTSLDASQNNQALRTLMGM